MLRKLPGYLQQYVRPYCKFYLNNNSFKTDYCISILTAIQNTHASSPTL